MDPLPASTTTAAVAAAGPAPTTLTAAGARRRASMAPGAGGTSRPAFLAKGSGLLASGSNSLRLAQQQPLQQQKQQRRESLAVMSRLAAQNRHANEENQEPRLPFSRSSRARKVVRKADTNDEENDPAAATPGMAGTPLAPAVSTNILKPSTGIYAGPTTPSVKATRAMASVAPTPQRLQQDANTMLTRLQSTVARAQGESERLAVIAARMAAKGSSGKAGAANARPSAEVLDMCRRLVAATESAVKSLQILFPAVAHEEEEEAVGDKAGAETQGAESAPTSEELPTGRPAVVAEEATEEEEEEEEEELEEGEIREPTPSRSRRSSTAAAETEELRTMVEEVGQQLQETEEEEALAVVVDEEEEEEAVPARVRDPDSPPSMSDLGLSHATRRFILAAKDEATAVNDSHASHVSTASPASPVLPKEKTAASSYPPGTPTYKVATVDGVREFPSPVFRTGVKLKHPPSAHGGRSSLGAGGAGGPTTTTTTAAGVNGSIHSSASSSSCRSPALFEPKSVSKDGNRRSLHAPPLFGSANKLNTTASVGKGAAGAMGTSFASSSAAATPALGSPSLLGRHNMSLSLLHTNASNGSSAAGSDDPTPELTSPAKTPFRMLPAIDATAGGSQGTPSTARCIRLLQFPPSGGGGGGGATTAVPAGEKSGGRRKSLSRTPAGAMAAAAAAAAAADDGMDMVGDESFTHNYPDLTSHSTRFVFSPKGLVGLGLEQEDGQQGPRYYLRSAEKKARELAMAKAEEEEATRRVAAARALAAARRSPRLKSPGGGVLMSDTRKSPRVARMALEREVEGISCSTSRLFAAEMEEEAAPAGVVCRPIPTVTVEEFVATPSFIQMQVTRDILNGTIAAFNAYTSGRQGGRNGFASEGLPLDRVTEVIGQGDMSKTVLLSLIHLKRVEIVNAGGQKTYKIWK